MDSIDYYNKYANTYYNNTVDLNMEEIIRPFIELLPENSEILDMGCGSGRDTLLLEEEGFYVTALDGSEEMCKLASIHTDKDVLHITYDEMDFEDVFDGIWACAALVHLTKDEMTGVLEKVVCALKSQGILYISLLAGDFEGFRDGRYVHEYSTKDVRNLLGEQEELAILDIWKTDDVRSDRAGRQWINVLARKTETAD